MLRDGDDTGLWHLIDSSMKYIFIHGHIHLFNFISSFYRAATIIGNIPWIAEYAKQVPGVGKDLKAFRSFGMTQASIRKTQGSQHRDLFHYLVIALGLFRFLWLTTVSRSLTKKASKNNRFHSVKSSQMELWLSLRVSTLF